MILLLSLLALGKLSITKMFYSNHKKLCKSLFFLNLWPKCRCVNVFMSVNLGENNVYLGRYSEREIEDEKNWFS